MHSDSVQKRLNLKKLQPKFVYRGCETAVNCLEVVKLKSKMGVNHFFLWAGEQDGSISIYNLSSQHLVLRFKNFSKSLHNPKLTEDAMESVLGIADLDGGYVLTYSRSPGMQIWYWTLSDSALPASLVGITNNNTLDPILSIPSSPKLIASFPTDSFNFCCPSVLKALPEKTKIFSDGLVRRLKWIASSYSERALIEIVCVCLPPLATDFIDHEVYFQSPETFFTRVSNFQVASDDIMPMSLELYSTVCADSENAQECFLLIAFEDGSLQWHLLGLDQHLEVMQVRHQLLWEITYLHSTPILAVAISEDMLFGFSVCTDGKLARFKFDYSGAELAKIQGNERNAPKLRQPILEPPNMESHSITMKQLNSGGSCATIRNGTITIGHFDNSIGIYSIPNMQLIRKLIFHRKRIAQVFYFDGSDCIARTLKTSHSSLFVASQDSRISLWEALEL